MSAKVESIPVDQCICGSKRKNPRADCWAAKHDCEDSGMAGQPPKVGQVVGPVRPGDEQRVAIASEARKLAAEHDRSLASYDRALGEGRN